MTKRSLCLLTAGTLLAAGLATGCRKQREQTAGPKAPARQRPQRADARPTARADARPARRIPILPRASGERAEYRVLLGKDTVGHAVSQRLFAKDRIVSEDNLGVTILRGGAEITLKMVQHFEETPDGTPLSFFVRLKQKTKDVAIRDIEVRGKILGNTVEITDAAGTRRLPFDPKWIFPAKADRLVRAKGFKPGTKGSLWTFVPELGNRGYEVHWKVTRDRTIRWKGRAVTCHEVITTVQGLSQETACVNDRGVAYERNMSYGPVTVKLVLERWVGRKGEVLQ